MSRYIDPEPLEASPENLKKWAARLRETWPHRPLVYTIATLMEQAADEQDALVGRVRDLEAKQPDGQWFVTRAELEAAESLAQQIRDRAEHGRELARLDTASEQQGRLAAEARVAQLETAWRLVERYGNAHEGWHLVFRLGEQVIDIDVHEDAWRAFALVSAGQGDTP